MHTHIIPTEASREGGEMLLKLVEHVCRMKEASEDLTNRQSATTRTSEETILTLYTSLEGLTETSRALHESSLQWAWLMGSSSPFQKHFSALETTSELLETIHHQTALYASKLLKVQLCYSGDTNTITCMWYCSCGTVGGRHSEGEWRGAVCQSGHCVDLCRRTHTS